MHTVFPLKIPKSSTLDTNFELKINKWSKKVSEYDQEIPQSQTTDNTIGLAENKSETLSLSDWFSIS